VQTDAQGCPIRVGKASEGLEARYRGGTGYAIDAAMHPSGNLVFVAAVDKKTLWIRRERVNLARQALPNLQQPWQNCPTNPPHTLVAYGQATDLERFECRCSLKFTLTTSVHIKRDARDVRSAPEPCDPNQALRTAKRLQESACLRRQRMQCFAASRRRSSAGRAAVS
jgi:hypothetical protein